MKARQYVMYSILYVALFWVFMFTFFNNSWEVTFFGYTLQFSIATWVTIPIAIFALMSFLHISYYGVKNFFGTRAIKNDANLYDTLAKEVFLGLESNKEFKTDLFKNAVETTKALSPWLNLGEPKFSNDDLQFAYEISTKVRNGEVCDLKKIKLLKTNPLFIQNEINKIKADYKYAMGIIDSKNIDQKLYKVAYNTLIENATHLELLKFDFIYSNDDIFKILRRYVDGNNFEIASTNLANMLIKNEFSVPEYIVIAKLLKTKLEPDKLIAIFEQLKNEHANATEAYFYVLYDLQMLEQLRENLAGCQNGEFEKIRVLLFLRENGKNVSAELLYH